MRFGIDVNWGSLMSVQAGIWNFNGAPIDRRLLDDFADSLKPQGPDGESRFVDATVALLYRPFHTTRESRGEKQPHVSRRGFVITWDGRLDNREALATKLGDVVDSSSTDVAMVAAAFDRWQSGCFQHIVGDWAVSVWCADRRELVLACDYMAIRHIFYSLNANRVWWSTDLSPLVLLANQKFHVDDDYVAGYLAHDPEAHLTPYREIRQVPPGQFVRICNRKSVVERFWKFKPQSRIRYKTDTEYEEHFRHVFRQAVQRRLRSDSPVLAELSGGLDSSSIVCMADDIIARGGQHNVCLDTISYYDKTEPNGDDWLYLRKIEEKRGRAGIHIDASVVGDSPGSMEYSQFNSLPGALGVGQSIGEERALAVRNGGYRAVLSGIGGDEFLGGVPDPRAQLADLIVQFKLISLAQQLTAWSLVKRKPWIQLIGQAAGDLLPASLGQYFVKSARIEPWIRKDFARRTRLAIQRLDVDEHFGLLLPTRRSYISGVQLMGCKLAKFAPPTTALEEARYPYLDQDLIEFLLSIPASQLLRPGERRSLMRRSLIGIVPDEVLSRRTKQMGARTPAKALDLCWSELEQAFHRSLTSAFGYVHEDRMLKTISDIRAGKVVSLVRVFWAISLEYWLRDLARRGLIETPAMSSPLATSRQLRATA